MTFGRSVRLLLGLAVPLVPGIATGQDANDYGAYAALVGTPVGALPPVMTSTIVVALQRTTQFSARYGYMRNYADSTSGSNLLVGANNFAATVTLPTGLGSTVSFTAGAWYATTERYGKHLMLSGGGDYRLGSAAISDSPDAPLISLALDGEVGFGAPSGGTLWSARMGAPVSLVSRETAGMQVAPFVTPSLGFGVVNDDGRTRGGMRFMVGGGVGVYNPTSTVSANLGFQHVFIRGSSTQVGVVLSLGSK